MTGSVFSMNNLPPSDLIVTFVLLSNFCAERVEWVIIGKKAGIMMMRGFRHDRYVSIWIQKENP
jgi:hypothetical protein